MDFTSPYPAASSDPSINTQASSTILQPGLHTFTILLCTDIKQEDATKAVDTTTGQNDKDGTGMSETRIRQKPTKTSMHKLEILRRRFSPFL